MSNLIRKDGEQNASVGTAEQNIGAAGGASGADGGGTVRATVLVRLDHPARFADSGKERAADADTRRRGTAGIVRQRLARDAARKPEHGVQSADRRPGARAGAGRGHAVPRFQHDGVPAGDAADGVPAPARDYQRAENGGYPVGNQRGARVRHRRAAAGKCAVLRGVAGAGVHRAVSRGSGVFFVPRAAPGRRTSKKHTSAMRRGRCCCATKASWGGSCSAGSGRSGACGGWCATCRWGRNIRKKRTRSHKYQFSHNFL